MPSPTASARRTAPTPAINRRRASQAPHQPGRGEPGSPAGAPLSPLPRALRAARRPERARRPRPRVRPAAAFPARGAGHCSGVSSLRACVLPRARLARPAAMLLRAMVGGQTRAPARAGLRRCQRPCDTRARTGAERIRGCCIVAPPPAALPFRAPRVQGRCPLHPRPSPGRRSGGRRATAPFRAPRGGSKTQGAGGVFGMLTKTAVLPPPKARRDVCGDPAARIHADG